MSSFQGAVSFAVPLRQIYFWKTLSLKLMSLESMVNAASFGSTRVTCGGGGGLRRLRAGGLHSARTHAAKMHAAKVGGVEMSSEPSKVHWLSTVEVVDCVGTVKPLGETVHVHVPVTVAVQCNSVSGVSFLGDVISVESLIRYREKVFRTGFASGRLGMHTTRVETMSKVL